MAMDTSKTIAADGNGSATSRCWSCGDMRAAQFCKACGKVQPPAAVDYFAFFGMGRKLNLDGARLEREFYELSRRLHPDLNARAAGEVKKQIVPPDLLEEVFELNLQLEEARMYKKTGEADPVLVKDLEGHKAAFEKKYEELSQELRGRWGEWDRAIESENEEARRRALDGMVDLLNRRSYIRNLVRDVNEALEN